MDSATCSLAFGNKRKHLHRRAHHAGGTWSFDSAFLMRDGNTFTALKTGTTTVTYTAEGQSVYYTVNIEKAQLPSTGQNFVWVIILSGIALTALLAAAVAGKRKARA